MAASLAVTAPQTSPSTEKLEGPPDATRNRLPDERSSITHKFQIANHEGYLTVGLYPNGEPGEIFIRMAKEGSTTSGLLDSFAQAVSMGLQYGVPLSRFCHKLTHMRFEPCGYTGNAEIRFAHSIIDYIFQWLQLRFLPSTPEQTAVTHVNGNVPTAIAPESHDCR